MEECWRWFGPKDACTLRYVAQAGATGVVSALHEIPYGEIWSIEAIRERQQLIEADPSLGLSWRVVESLPIHERIKLGDGDLAPLFDAYRQSLRNLAACGIRIVCYNFMPILDWTRTDLARPLSHGGHALSFDMTTYVAFDRHMLERRGAEDGIDDATLDRARVWYERSSEADRAKLLTNIMSGLPGAYARYDVPGLRAVLQRYDDVSRDQLRRNFVHFLREVIPTAQEVGVRLCVHPDDPPRPLFGLDRIVSTADDIDYVLSAVPSPSNGLTLCAGSLGARPDNDVPAIAARFADRIHFAHLRNVRKQPDGSFFEDDHLGGDTDMVALIRVLERECRRRRAAGRDDWSIPMRPDHGHALIDDDGRRTHPGYPVVGRLRGLAELRGVMTAVRAIDAA